MRVVAKIGTASITDTKGAIERAAIAKLCDEVSDLRKQGHEVIVVSSGAVAAGVAAVGLSERPGDMPRPGDSGLLQKLPAVSAYPQGVR